MFNDLFDLLRLPAVSKPQTKNIIKINILAEA